MPAHKVCRVGKRKWDRYESHSDTSHFVLKSLIGVVLLIRLSDGKLVSWFFIKKKKIEKMVNDAEGEKHGRILVGIKDLSNDKSIWGK